MIKIDMAKAKEIHRNKIRIARKPLLEAKDVAFMRAVEVADVDTQAQIAVEKQVLRDAPSALEIESATTLDELKLTWDEALLGENPYN